MFIFCICANRWCSLEDPQKWGKVLSSKSCIHLLNHLQYLFPGLRFSIPRLYQRLLKITKSAILRSKNKYERLFIFFQIMYIYIPGSKTRIAVLAWAVSLVAYKWNKRCTLLTCKIINKNLLTCLITVRTALITSWLNNLSDRSFNSM